jgi:hypothetical protein
VIIFGTLFQLSIGINYCPNSLCPCVEKLEKGKKCPICGTEARKFGIRQSIDLLKEKHNQSDSAKREGIKGEGKNEIQTAENQEKKRA